MDSNPDFETFNKNYAAGFSQLVWRAIPADLETPVSAYLKLCGGEKFSLLLESVEGGAVLGRYSAIGLHPDYFWRCRAGMAEISADAHKWTSVTGIHPLNHLKAAVTDSCIDVTYDLPPMAASGLFGYLGYDMVRLVEDIPAANPDTLGIPDALMMRPTVMAIFDNIKHVLYLCTPVRLHAGNSSAPARDCYTRALAKLDKIEYLLKKPLKNKKKKSKCGNSPVKPSSNMTQAAYHAAVHKAKEYIRAGDIFQVVPSQRFCVDFDLPSIEFYRALRRINPSPFLFHIQCGDFTLAGSSPEIMVRVRDDVVTIHPIAGTRKRGANGAEDALLAQDLLNDPKERAEHLMLLDLARNDVGKIAEMGSIRVTDSFSIEYYSHVMHIVSNVEGMLRKDLSSLDALFSGFPAGTVSGAPKIRAMEIIDELEPEKRGFYGGCIGYLDGGGNVDTCIALRTALIKDQKLYVQAGAGVVADSDPESEYQETCNKARAIIQAAEMALRQAGSRPY